MPHMVVQFLQKYCYAFFGRKSQENSFKCEISVSLG